VPKALLAFGTGPSFLTAGIPIDRDALVAEAGLDLRVSANATIGIAYTGQVGSRAEDHAAKGNFTYRF
jgi:subtilase-type serine protease